jgi:hypothetical protein
LEKSKKYREEFMNGGNPKIGLFLINELPELTFEAFHGYS